MERGIPRDRGAEKIQTKEARNGVGVEGLTELGEGREENCRESLEKYWGLELESWRDRWHLELFLLTCSRQKFEWGLPRLVHLQVPEAALVRATWLPGPWCVVSARRSWNAAPGQLLTGRSRAAATRDLGGRDPPAPAARKQSGKRSGRGMCGVPGLRLFGDLGAVKALPGAPGFFCPARGAQGLAGREQGMGVGLLECRGGLGSAWAGKACLEPSAMCKNFLSPRRAKWRLPLWS